MRFGRRLTCAVVLAVVSVGCSGQQSPPTPSPTATTAPADAVVIPDTAAGRATRWVLEQLAAPSGPGAAEATEVFAQVFLDAIAAPDIAGVFDQLRALGPYTVTRYDEGAVSNAQTLLTGLGGLDYVLTVSTDAAGLIQGLWLAPAPELPVIGDLDDVAGVLGDAGDQGSYLLARVSGDGAQATCEPVGAHEPDALRPVGSVFKLYVLAAVVQAVADGDLAWDDVLTLTDDLRSFPSGMLQEEPAGTQVSIRDAAGAMIEISDNTATDLLIDAVGRDAVEAAVVRMGHSAPETLRPFVTTREMFLLGYVSRDERARWVEATGEDPLSLSPQVSERQALLLDTLPKGLVSLDTDLLTEPVWPVGLDWFATAEDVCRAHLGLQALAETDAGAPVRPILSANPGGGIDTSDFDYVAFKGGSAPGEIAGSWYTETADGARYVLVVQSASVEGAAPGGRWLVSVADQTLALAGA